MKSKYVLWAEGSRGQGVKLGAHGRGEKVLPGVPLLRSQGGDVRQELEAKRRRETEVII